MSTLKKILLLIPPIPFRFHRVSFHPIEVLVKPFVFQVPFLFRDQAPFSVFIENVRMSGNEMVKVEEKTDGYFLFIKSITNVFEVEMHTPISFDNDISTLR